MAQGAARRVESQLHLVSTNEVKRKPPGSEKKVLDLLIQNVVDAAMLKSEACEAFNAAIDQFPSGLPHPDGAQLVKNTSAQLAAARKTLMTAHNHLDDFLHAGIVPEDLKRSDS
jgi:hypothetical protein